MKFEFTENAWEDLAYWKNTDADIYKKLMELLHDIKSAPFHGLGKPEPLKFDLKGYWSRRITGEHRLVYKIEGKKDFDQVCYVIQCRYHYDT